MAMKAIVQPEARREQFRRVADETVEILKLASSLIDEIARGIETFRLYTEDHQHSSAVTRDILEKIRALFYNRRVFTIDVGLRRFLVQGLPIYEVNKAGVGGQLHDRFLKMKVGGLTFTEGVNSSQIAAFMRLLSDAAAQERDREWLCAQLSGQHIDKINVDLPLLEDLAESEAQANEEGGDDADPFKIQSARRGRRDDELIEVPRKVYQIAVGMVRDMMHSPNQPEQINVRDVTKMAENLVDCLFKRPEELTAVAIAGRLDEYQYAHPVNVAVFGARVAAPILQDTRQLVEFTRIALLYDVGKSHLPRELFFKPAPLSLEEFDAVRQHPVISAELLDRHTEIEKLAVVVAFEHHAAQRAGGYPAIDAAADANIVTRIIRVAEAFDALVSHEVYRRAVRPHQAIAKLLEEFQGGAEAVLTADLACAIGLTPAGSIVTLSDGRVAIVVSQVKDRLLFPVVRVVADRSGGLVKKGETFATGADCRIADVIPPGRVPFCALDFYPFSA
jgi:HD-GYP domain-containing protein (c-di-GMP phosphodiesterase class II)